MRRLKCFLNWASSWDYGTYHIGDQRRLRRACASAQSRQNLRYSHTQRKEDDEGSDKKSDIKPHWMDAYARLKNEFTEDEKYHNLMTLLIYGSMSTVWIHHAPTRGWIKCVFYRFTSECGAPWTLHFSVHIWLTNSTETSWICNLVALVNVLIVNVVLFQIWSIPSLWGKWPNRPFILLHVH